MNHRLLFFIVFALPFLIMTSCRDDDDEPTLPKAPFERTVLVYMAAQNSLGADRYHVDDSLEIAAAAESIGKNQCLLVYVDDAKKPRIYRVGHEKKGENTVRTWDTDVSSVDPKTLTDVLSWMSKKYTAKEYGLVMWSHATGWVPATSTSTTKSFGIDTGVGGSMYSDRDVTGKRAPQMNIYDMAVAIEESGIHLRYILFDACLMQGIENCFDLRHATDYVIASPISIHADGGYYTNLVKHGFFCEDITQIARTYFSDVSTMPIYYNEHYQKYYGIVISVVKTSALDSLANTMHELLPQSKVMGGYSPNLTGVTKYATYSSYTEHRPHCFDALEAMEHLLAKEDFETWKAALEKVVVYHEATPEFVVTSWSNQQKVNLNATMGISMFIPQTIYTDNRNNCPYGDLNEAFRKTKWYEAAGWAQTGW